MVLNLCQETPRVLGNDVALPHNTKPCSGCGSLMHRGRNAVIYRYDVFSDKGTNLNCMQLLLLRGAALHPWKYLPSSEYQQRMEVEVPISSQRQMWHFRRRGIQGNNQIWDREWDRILENEREGRRCETAIKGMRNGGQSIHKPRGANKMVKTREEKKQLDWFLEAEVVMPVGGGKESRHCGGEGNKDNLG